MIDGSKIFIDRSDPLELSSGIGKRDPLIKLVEKLLVPGNTVVDVGAHIGFVTIMAANKVGSLGKVYAFEPEPGNFRLLKKNVGFNNFKNVVCHNLALGGKKGTGVLYLNPENSGNNFLFSSSFSHGFKAIKVNVEKLDNILKRIDVDLLKIDVEGYEYFILLGTRRILERNRNIVVITEYCPEFLKSSGSLPEEFIGYMRKFGFSLVLIDEKSGVFRDMSKSPIADIDFYSRGSCNLLFSRNRNVITDLLKDENL